ncbi:MAG: hypothetical protein GXP25_17480 [Planctomycetes bacterium]|nr:hypothetical protein [Planctomycetota bacterium]
MKERPYLLTRALRLPMTEREMEYDTVTGLNMIQVNGSAAPAVTNLPPQETSSKTMAAPGDDDPDPDDEDCY